MSYVSYVSFSCALIDCWQVGVRFPLQRKYHSTYPSSCSASLVYVGINIDVVVSGPGLTAAAIYAVAILGPLRVNTACHLDLAIANVIVSSIAGTDIIPKPALISISLADTINTMSAPCPPITSSRLLRVLALESKRRVSLATMSSALIVLLINIPVPASAVLNTTSQALMLLPPVTNTLAALAVLFPPLPANATAATSMPSQALAAFSAATAFVIGALPTDLRVGSLGSPSVSLRTSNTAMSHSNSGVPVSGLSSGALAGIVLAVVVLVAVGVSAFCVRRMRRTANAKMSHAVTIDSPHKGNPLLALSQSSNLDGSVLLENPLAQKRAGSIAGRMPDPRSATFFNPLATRLAVQRLAAPRAGSGSEATPGNTEKALHLRSAVDSQSHVDTRLSHPPAADIFRNSLFLTKSSIADVPARAPQSVRPVLKRVSGATATAASMALAPIATPLLPRLPPRDLRVARPTASPISRGQTTTVRDEIQRNDRARETDHSGPIIQPQLPRVRARPSGARHVRSSDFQGSGTCADANEHAIMSIQGAVAPKESAVLEEIGMADERKSVLETSEGSSSGRARLEVAAPRLSMVSSLLSDVAPTLALGQAVPLAPIASSRPLLSPKLTVDKNDVSTSTPDVFSEPSSVGVFLQRVSTPSTVPMRPALRQDELGTTHGGDLLPLSASVLVSLNTVQRRVYLSISSFPCAVAFTWWIAEVLCQ